MPSARLHQMQNDFLAIGCICLNWADVVMNCHTLYNYHSFNIDCGTDIYMLDRPDWIRGDLQLAKPRSAVVINTRTPLDYEQLLTLLNY